MNDCPQTHGINGVTAENCPYCKARRTSDRVRRWSGPDANNVGTEWVTLRASDYEALQRGLEQARAGEFVPDPRIQEPVCPECFKPDCACGQGQI